MRSGSACPCAGEPDIGLSVSDREFPAMTGRSGTQRACAHDLCTGHQVSEQVDPPVVAAKCPPSEFERALSQVREAALLAELVGRTVRDCGKGVDLPELPFRPRLLQDLPHCLAGNPPALELGEDHPPNLIERLIPMRRLENVDHTSGGGGTVRDDLQRPAPSCGGQASDFACARSMSSLGRGPPSSAII